MAKRLGIGGRPNTGKSYTRRYIPDGQRVMVIQPSQKASYLYRGKKEDLTKTTEQLDADIKAGTRQMIGDFDISSPDGKFENIQGAMFNLSKAKDASPNPTMFDALATFTKHKAPDYFKKENLKGNVIYAPEFEQLEVSLEFVDKCLPWIHTVILPDFTHFITDKLTSKQFLARQYGNDAYARYLELAAESFRGFIKKSDMLRKDLVVVTEFHTEVNEQKEHELFVPGGKMVKEKFLPSSYYDAFLFTKVTFNDLDETKPPTYQYVTKPTKSYPEARSGGLFDEVFVPNNLQEVLTRMRAQFNIPIIY